MQRGTGTLTPPGSIGLGGLIGLGAFIGLGGVGGLGALVAGCAASGGDESLFVLKNVAPPTETTGGVCTFTASETEAGIVHGVLDTTAGTSYEFTAQLKSRVTAAIGQEDQRTIFVRGANVDLKLADTSLLTADELAALSAKNLLHFMAPFSAELPPNGGMADAPFELVPAEIAAAVGAKPGFTSTVVQATFTVVGDLAGGSVSSQPFQYSVTLAKQALLIDQGDCATVLRSFIPRTGNPCYFGQDLVVDCCTDRTVNPPRRTCPAIGTKL